MAEAPFDTRPGYRYHLLRGALERFSRNLADLDESQLTAARRQADKTWDIEALVLASPDAADIVIPSQQVDEALAAVAERYNDPIAFMADLAANGLDEQGMREALRRELAFDCIMQRVAAKRLTVSQIDARLYYEFHPEQFTQPEQRTTRQILITINDDFAENSRDPALARCEHIAEQINGNGKRFARQAEQHSECPSALDGGRLGDIRRGQLYPELDSVLFNLAEGEVSAPIETEVGFHLLYCERIQPAKKLPFSKVEARIRALLDERNRRNCQKAYLKQLRQQRQGED